MTQKKKTNGQIEMAKAIMWLDWAARMFDESVTPQVVDVDRLVEQIRTAVLARRAEVVK